MAKCFTTISIIVVVLARLQEVVLAECTVSLCVACPGDENTCTKCQKGFVLINNECRACPANCKKCINDDGEAICKVCEDGYDVVLGRCIEESTCKTIGCAKCDGKKCVECKNGFQPINQADNQCHPCPPGCAECVNANECLKCVEGIAICTGLRPDPPPFLEDDCINNHRFCTKCESVQKCTECDERHRLVTKGDKITCERCSHRRCLKCDDGDCTECKTGFVPDGVDCKKCRIGGCAECPQGVQTCDACRPGRKLSVEDGNVICDFEEEPLPPPCKVKNCVECESGSTTKCKVCKAGFKLTKKGKCKRI